MLDYKDMHSPNLSFEIKDISPGSYKIGLWLGEKSTPHVLGYGWFWKLPDTKKLEFLGEVETRNPSRAEGSKIWQAKGTDSTIWEIVEEEVRKKESGSSVRH